MFTPRDRSNIAWFWKNYLRSRVRWLAAIFAVIVVQGVAYQQFLAMTETGLRVIFQDGSVSDLLRTCLVVFALFSLRGATSYIIPRMATWLSANAVLELRERMSRHLLALDLKHFDTSSSGNFILRLVRQADALSNFVGTSIINAVRDAVTVTVVSGYLIYKAPVLFLSAVVVAPAILVLLQYVSNRIKEVQAQSEAAMGAYINSLEETVNGMRTVKVSNQEPVEICRLMEAAGAIRDKQINLNAAQATVMPAIDIASAFAYALVIGFGGYMAISPAYDLDGAAIITFLLGLIMVFDPLRALAKFFATLQARLVMLEGVRSFLEIEPTITDREGAQETFDTGGDIVFDSVRFGYRRKDPLFKNLSMTFSGGKRTAIVGATGSGKTTILSLLGRLYDVDKGAITIGGTDIRDIRVASLRQSFSVVAQDIVIFNASLWENIAYVRPDATEEEVWEAARSAEIADLIKARGDTPLGPKGAQLSGGQKQRVAIARAFLRSAPILLLDEATSALDQRTEEKVRRALKRLSRDKTTIVVAHRLSAVTHVDKIYVLDNGRIVEEGSHDELLAEAGLYAGMYTTQKDEYR